MSMYCYDEHAKNSCIVYNKKKIIFINIPKCASKSIKKSLYKYNPQHKNINTLSQTELSYFIFTFIRDPIQRFLSGYITILFKYDNVSDLCKSLSFWKISDKKERFNDFCKCVQEHGFFDCHIAPYSYFLDDFSKIDYIGCLETYNNDINYIYNKFDIKYKIKKTNQKHKWNSTNPELYQLYYININELIYEQLNIIKELYKDDIKLYNKISKNKI